MSTLSDVGILHALEATQINITPYDPVQLQPCSYDVTLGDTFLKLKPGLLVDPENPPAESDYDHFQGPTLLPPGGFTLGTTVETISIGNAHMATVHGKSSLARLGLQVHAAGHIDPGFSGQITLEIENQGRNPIILKPGTPIAQLTFEQLDGPSASPYQTKGRYQGQTGVTISKGTR